MRYRYEFTDWDDDTDAWWKRELLGEYLPPLSTDNPNFHKYLRGHGWLE
jgi:hypothetical protein